MRPTLRLLGAAKQSIEEHGETGVNFPLGFEAMTGDGTVNRSAVLASIAISAFAALDLAVPALALDRPVVWRDEETGCAYLLTPQGGIAPRHRRDGALDCPDVPANAGIVDNTAREVGRGLDLLQREVERLRERYNSRP